MVKEEEKIEQTSKRNFNVTIEFQMNDFFFFFFVLFFSLSHFTDTPSFAISRTPGFGYPLREGIEVSLKCDVDSNPPSTPIWQKDDGDPPVI